MSFEIKYAKFSIARLLYVESRASFVADIFFEILAAPSEKRRKKNDESERIANEKSAKNGNVGNARPRKLLRSRKKSRKSRRKSMIRNPRKNLWMPRAKMKSLWYVTTWI